MAQIAKVEAKVEIKSPADKFYGFFKNNMNRLVQMFPEKIKSFELLDGDEMKYGSLIRLKYDLGSPMTAKVKIEALDNENKLITFAIPEGDILNLYTSFKADLQVINAGYAKWSIEYEKANESAPDPEIYRNFAVMMNKGLDANLSRA